MAEPGKQDASTQAPKIELPKAAPPKQNPVFRMMGIPNFRWRLPSRNWMIFWTVTGSFTGAIIYDRRQKKKVQKKWCDLVAHVSQQTLSVNQLPRKITVFLSAPPGDGIGPSRQYFKDYIKPVLVAAAMDYDVIEGRKEGDVRYGTAESIRRLRRKKGETGNAALEQELDAATIIEMHRESVGIVPEAGLRGDLVLGRHTWKEYVRGLHEGWLGPLDEPIPEPAISPETEPSPIHPPTEARTDNPVATLPEDGNLKPEEPEEVKEEKKEDEDKKKKKSTPPPAYLSTSAYPSAPLSPHIPQSLEPSISIHQQHLLGFLKTPQRIYNFLNRRKLADDLGRDAAAIVLAAYRPYEQSETFSSTGLSDETIPLSTKAPENDAAVVQTGTSNEQQSVLIQEEPYWHKSIRKPRKEGDEREQIWMSDIIFDSRIATRMRKFQLTSDEEQRASRIARGEEKTLAREVDDLTKREVTVGDVDGGS